MQPGLTRPLTVLDLGAQSLHISNQSDIYALRPELHSRLNTGYMLGYFTGGAVMSAAASLVFSAAGWAGVCFLGALTATAGLASWPSTRRPRAAASDAGPGTGVEQNNAGEPDGQRSAGR